MKQLFILLALAASMAACNNSGDTTAEKKDSLDSVANQRKDVIDSSAEQRKDAVDSTVEMKKNALDRADSMRQADSSQKK